MYVLLAIFLISSALYVFDRRSLNKRKVLIIAGNLSIGSVNGPGAIASFNQPNGISINSGGRIIDVADTGNSLIRKITLK